MTHSRIYQRLYFSVETAVLSVIGIVVQVSNLEECLSLRRSSFLAESELRIQELAGRVTWAVGKVY